MVRVYPITPQSQFKNNSRAAVPLSKEVSNIWKQIRLNMFKFQKIPCMFVHSDKEKNLGTTYFKTKVTVF